jgi:hypothetical protein
MCSAYQAGQKVLAVSSLAGFGRATITHNNAPAGAQYVLQYSTNPGFSSYVEVDNGSSLTWQQYLKGQTLYFRAAARFLSSEKSPWVYYGSQASPTPVRF